MSSEDWVAVVGLMVADVGILAVVARVLGRRLDRVEDRVDRIINLLAANRRDQP